MMVMVVQERGARSISIFAAHGLFTSNALEKIEASEDVNQVFVTNTIPLPDGYKGNKVRNGAIGVTIIEVD